MANPRQRRKARSSSHKPIRHSSRAKRLLHKQPPIRGPQVLSEAWDKTKTVRQNYAALGLAHTLSPLDSGGSEDAHRRDERPKRAGEGANAVSASSGNETDDGQVRVTEDGSGGGLPRGFGRIVRDGAGNVVGVELGADDGEDAGMDASEGVEQWDQCGLANMTASAEGWLLQDSGPAGGVVHALEQQAGGSSAPGTGKQRFSSTAEQQYLQRLVAAHGSDVDQMARDRKLNTQQYTAGQLRKALARAGGVDRVHGLQLN